MDRAVCAQIKSIAQSISKKNVKACITELRDLILVHGEDCHLFLLRCLLEDIDLNDQKPSKDPSKAQVLLQEITDLSTRANFTSIICRSFEAFSNSPDFLSNLTRVLKLSLNLQILVSLALAQANEKVTQEEAQKFLKHRLHEFMEPGTDPKPPLSNAILHELLYFVKKTPGYLGKQRAQSLKLLNALQINSTSAPHMLPLLDSPEYFEGKFEPMDSTTGVMGATVRLCDVLHDVGSQATASLASFRTVLSSLPAPLSEVDVAQAIAFLMRPTSGDETAMLHARLLTQALAPLDDEDTARGAASPSASKQPEPAAGWRADVFVAGIMEIFPSIDWLAVFGQLDQPQFYVPDENAFQLLLAIGKQAIPGSPGFPLEHLFTSWKHENGRLSVLRFCITSAPSNFFQGSSHVQPPLDALSPSSPSSSQPWLSLNLIDALLRLCEHTQMPSTLAASPVHPYRQSALELIQHGISTCPELLLCGLVQLAASPPPLSPLHATPSSVCNALIDQLLPLYLCCGPPGSGGIPASARVCLNAGITVARAWRLNFRHVVATMVKCYSRIKDQPRPNDPSLFNLNALFIALFANHVVPCDADAITTLLGVTALDFSFALDLAVLAVQNGMLNADVWLSERLSQHGDAFAHACLSFLRSRVASPSGSGLPVLLLASFFKVLLCGRLSSQTQPMTISVETHKLIIQDFVTYCAMPAYSQLAEFTTSQVVEKEVYLLLQKFYAQIVPLPQLIDMLHRFATSNEPRDKEMLTCFLHDLFEEYRYFHAYPPKELRLTALLLGLIIQNKLVTSVKLGLALRYVLDSLKSSDANMFKFGLTALEQFRSRLSQWPQYCALLVQIPQLQQFTEIIAFLSSILQQAAPTPTPQPSTSSPALLAPAPTTGAVSKSTDASQVVKAVLQQQTAPHAPLEFTKTVDTLITNYLSPVVGPRTTVTLTEPQSQQQQTHEQPPRTYDLNLSSTLAPAPSLPSAPAPFGSGLPSGVRPGNTSVPPGGKPPVPGQLSSSSPLFTIPAPLSPAETNASPAQSPQVPNSAQGKHGTSYDTLDLASSASPNAGATAPSMVDAAASAFAPDPSQRTVLRSTSMNQPLSLDTLLQTPGPKVIQPPDDVVDKLYFIVNNISKMNMRQKTAELKSILQPEHFPFFARYLVVRRVSQEPNNHILYSDFIEALADARLKQVMIATTYHNIQSLLESEKVISVIQERSLLKNLGSWLGLLTIAQNKPLRARQLDLKKILVDAYERGRLIAVIPFVAKILEACVKSRVFRPPNPWLMAIIALLREISDQDGLKLNLKFEIEVLFNVLELKPSDVAPTKLLQNKRPETSTDMKGVEPKANAASGSSLRPSSTNAEPGATPAHPPRPSSLQSTTPSAPISVPDLMPQFASYVVIAPSITLFSTHPSLKRLVLSAIALAVRDIIQPVVERSVTIACVTTRELVVKDFAMEPDENKMRTAALQMVQSLTSSLALVTCKDPLRNSITSHLQALLEQAQAQGIVNVPLDRTQIDQACMQISTDNLELGCRIIEKEAADRAAKEITDSLQSLFDARRRHRETGNPQPYYDASFFNSQSGRFPATLPESLRPARGGLLPGQLRVYEDFPRIRLSVPAGAPTAGPEHGISAPVAPGATATPSPLQPPPSPLKPTGPGGSGTATATGPAAAAREKLVQNLTVLEAAVARYPFHKTTSYLALQQAQPGSELEAVRMELDTILNLASTFLEQVPRDDPQASRDAVCISFAHRVFKRLFEREHRRSFLQIDVHVNILKRVKAVCPKLEITSWLLQADDDRLKYVLDITVNLLREQLLVTAEVDAYFSKVLKSLITTGNGLVVEAPPAAVPGAPPPATPPVTVAKLHPHLNFIMDMLRRLYNVIKENPAKPPPSISISEFSGVFENLHKLLQSAMQRRLKPLHDALGIFLDEIGQAVNGQQQQLALAQPQAAQAAASASTGAPLLPGQPGVTIAKRPSGDTGGLNVFGTVCNLEEAIDYLPRLEKELFEEPEPQGLRQQIVNLLDEWMRLCMYPNQAENTYSNYLIRVLQQQVLATADSSVRFFRIITQLCINSALVSRAKPDQSGVAQPVEDGQLTYTAVDALAKLIVFLVKFIDPSAAVPVAGTTSASLPVPNTPTKIRLLTLFLNASALVLRRDGDRKKKAFNQRPYLRLYSSLLQDLNTPDPALDSNNPDVLLAFGYTFHLLRPSRVPGFALSWLELISHRMFMPKCLVSKQNPQAAGVLHRLLVDLLSFLEPFLRNSDLTDGIRQLYTGTLRVLLVLLHDFPEFLCEHSVSLCDVIAPSCIQMRNLILSAFPKNMRLPDPFNAGLKIEELPDINVTPRIQPDYLLALERFPPVKACLDGYLKSRSQQSLKQLFSLLTHAGNTPESVRLIQKAGTAYNIPLINALVLYVGIEGINYDRKLKTMVHQGPPPPRITSSPSFDIFTALVTGLDLEGRFILINALANQLRFPNTHTYYFSQLVLALFLSARHEIIMEQITRVLLERLIVHRPHPWGLLITFIDLIKNPKYAFWDQAFCRCAPEIERLFDTVARSCMPQSSPAPQAPLPVPGTN